MVTSRAVCGRASCAFFKNQIFILQKSDFHPKIDYRKPWFFRRPGGARMLFRAAHVKLHEILQLLCPGLFLCNRLHHVENRLREWNLLSHSISLLLSHSSPCSWAISVLPCCRGATFASKSNANNKAKQSSALWTHCLLGSTKKLKMPN